MPKYALKLLSDGPPPSPHRWAIYRADQDYPVEKSREYFRSALLAKIAGNKALRELELDGHGIKGNR
jgi:hypothetical protein